VSLQLGFRPGEDRVQCDTTAATARHENGDSGLPSHQDYRKVRKRQSNQGRRDAANTDWFWVSAYILGMEEEVDTCPKELLHIHVAFSNLLLKKTAATSAITGAMTLVPVERTRSHRVTVPTVPPVALAGGLSNLPKHTPLATLPEAFAMRCRRLLLWATDVYRMRAWTSP
jgi:hypothetical protein